MSNYGEQVKTGDQFGILGWWVNCDLNFSPNPYKVHDIREKVGGGSKRNIYYYFGINEPSKKEMKELIDKIPSKFDDADY